MLVVVLLAVANAHVAVAAAPAKSCGPIDREGALTIPRGGGIRQVFRITDSCTIEIVGLSVLTLVEAERLGRLGSSPIREQLAGPRAAAIPRPRGLSAPVALVAGGPLHMKVRVLDGVGLNVTSIDPHDFSYGYGNGVITSYSQAAWVGRASDNSGFCGPGYYGWYLANGGLSISGGGLGIGFIDSLAHQEFWYQGIFSLCETTKYYNIIDTKLTGFGDGRPSSCAYRLRMANVAPGWSYDLLCWDAYSSTTPPSF